MRRRKARRVRMKAGSTSGSCSCWRWPPASTPWPWASPFAFLQVSILPAVLTIGLITFALSFAGVAVGNRFGTRFQKKAEIAGGAVLVLIGLKILLEHVGLL